jgi:hypothetical protein
VSGSLDFPPGCRAHEPKPLDREARWTRGKIWTGACANQRTPKRQRAVFTASAVGGVAFQPLATGARRIHGPDPAGFRQGAAACGRVVQPDCTRVSGVCHTRRSRTTYSITHRSAFDPTPRQPVASVEAATAAAIWRIMHPMTSDRRIVLADVPSGRMDWYRFTYPMRSIIALALLVKR